MIRRLIAGLVVVGLAIGVWALWPRDEPDPSPTTTVNAVDSTTNTSAPDPGTSTSLESHVVTTVEEAEAILRQLWFGWFEGIYNQDEDRIREVVGSQVLLDSAREAFSTMTFYSTPSTAAFLFQEMEILLASEECLVLWSRSDATFLENPEGALREGVDVLRWSGNGWVLVSSWQLKGDLWEADCESVLEPLS